MCRSISSVDAVGDGPSDLTDGTDLPPVPNNEDLVIQNSNSTDTPTKSVTNSTSLPTVKQLSAPLQPLKPLAAPLKERLKRVKSDGFIELTRSARTRSKNVRQYSQKMRSHSQNSEWGTHQKYGFKEHFEMRPLMPLTSGLTPFIEGPFTTIAVSICLIFLHLIATENINFHCLDIIMKLKIRIHVYFYTPVIISGLFSS
jgi:hypothetical protein